MDKICSRCKTPKDADEFSKNRTKSDGLNNVCKLCNKAYQKKYYRDNYEECRENLRKSNQRLRKRIREFVYEKKGAPCTDCKVQYSPWVMQFDHVSEDKLDDVARMAGQGRPIEKIQLEIDKCEVVCANCHAERTHNRLCGSQVLR